jgi:transposase
MSKQFRNCDLNQACLLPQSLQDWLPEGHVARFVADLVETLDLSAIYAKYEEGDGRGLAAYDPRMIVRLLIYAYCRGVPGSRRIERATYEDVGFRYLAADQHPDHDTIADFRKEHLANLSQLFVQVLKLCQQAGLVKLGHPARRDWMGPRSRPMPASTRR